MDLNFLDFEQPIAELEAKIKELRNVEFDNKININSVYTNGEADFQPLGRVTAYSDK
jgi:acetyl-CoA carboxylase carboxyl transferase subunit alpha